MAFGDAFTSQAFWTADERLRLPSHGIPVRVRVVEAAEIWNPHWLRPGPLSAGQQAIGDAMLRAHPIVLIPSVASSHTSNVIFDPVAARGLYGAVVQERFALDPRLHPPAGV